MTIKQSGLMVLAASLIIVGCSTPPQAPSTHHLGRTIHPYAPLNAAIPLDAQIPQPKAIKIFQSGDLKRQGNRPFTYTNLHVGEVQSSNRVREVTLADGRIGISLLDQKGQIVPISDNGQAIALPNHPTHHYRVHYRNYTTNVIFEVLPVNGAIDERTLAPKRFEERGHLLYPGQTLTLESMYPIGITGNAFFIVRDPQLRYHTTPSTNRP